MGKDKQRTFTVDFDGTITAIPDRFAVITDALRKQGHRIVVLTGNQSPADELKKQLDDWDIKYDALVQYEDNDSNGLVRAKYLKELNVWMGFDNRVDRAVMFRNIPHAFVIADATKENKEEAKGSKQDAKKAAKKALRSITLVNGPADGVVVEHRGLTNTIETAAGDLYWVNTDSDTADWIEPDEIAPLRQRAVTDMGALFDKATNVRPS